MGLYVQAFVQINAITTLWLSTKTKIDFATIGNNKSFPEFQK